MRRLNLKPKVQTVTDLPDDFVSFLSEVDALIKGGDERAVLESDDLLQCESAYGGLTEEGGSNFYFGYFPEQGIRVKWELLLDKSEIEQVARGELKVASLWRCKDLDCRCAFSIPTEACFYCDWEEIPD